MLKVFVAMFDEASVTRTGERLGLTQSAVSHALNRLRYALEDELFVRGPAGMQPTPRAREIAPTVRAALAQLQAALAPADFVPAETDRRFVISAGAYTTSVLAPTIAARFQAEAPHAALRVRTADISVVEELDTGGCDVAIGSFGRTPDRFALEPLFSDRLVWVMRRDHPLANEPLSLERLAEASHAVVASAEATDLVRGSVLEYGLERRVVLDDDVDHHLTAAGLQRGVVLTVADMHAALAIAARTDLVTQAPRGLFMLYGDALKLRAAPPPYPSPSLEVFALWRKDSNGPALQWLLGLLREAGRSFVAGPDSRAGHGL